MKFSYNWLKELSGTDKDPQELAQMLLIHSFEVESVENCAEGLEDVVIGHVVKKEKHPNADRLNVATVDVGTEQLQIVCGAPNLAEGQKVPVARVGATLPCGLTIEKSNIRDVESYGMICAEDELGIGKDHAGIIVLDQDAPIGGSYAEYAGLDDHILTIDILPNRGHDALSYHGMAREIQALEGTGSSEREYHLPGTAGNTIEVRIDTEKCTRYIATVLDDLTCKRSPAWLEARLRASDIKPINAIVDITNYVMLETGQPLHAFDATAVDQIIVRQAKQDEELTLLDEKTIALSPNDIVITDGTQPIALAGVMGGWGSAVTAQTQSIVLEAAHFDPVSIRFTQRSHDIHTDAAFRFERDIDPNLAQIATARAIDLYQELCDAHLSNMTDVYPQPVEPWTVSVDVNAFTRLLGIEIAQDTIVNILTLLGMHINMKGDVLSVSIPTVRRDITTPEDLIEEVGRIYGYDKIKKKPLHDAIHVPVRNEERYMERMLKDIAIASGFDEIRQYSFYSTQDAQAIGFDDEKHVALLNPLTPEHTLLRRTLAAGLVRSTKKNLSYMDAVRSFEIGRIYDPSENNLPDEKLVFGAIVCTDAINGSQFYELKGLFDAICDRLRVGDWYLDDKFDDAQTHTPHLHPSRRALARMADGTVFGWIGELPKKTHKYFGLKHDRVAVCEIDIPLLLEGSRRENFFTPLPRHPFVTRDLSLIVTERTRVGDVERTIYGFGGDLIKDVDLFDLYYDRENDEHSMAFHIVFGVDDRTLTSQEVDDLIGQIIDALEKDHNITIKK